MKTETTQVARIVASHMMSVMKHTLDLEELSYREDGRKDPRFKTFKKHLMEDTYTHFRALCDELSELGLVQKTPYDEDIMNGYKDSPTGGSGYINTDEFQEWLTRRGTQDT